MLMVGAERYLSDGFYYPGSLLYLRRLEINMKDKVAIKVNTR